MAVARIRRVSAVGRRLHIDGSAACWRLPVFRIRVQTPDRYRHRAFGRRSVHIHGMAGMQSCRPAAALGGKSPSGCPHGDQPPQRIASPTVHPPDGEPLVGSGGPPYGRPAQPAGGRRGDRHRCPEPNRSRRFHHRFPAGRSPVFPCAVGYAPGRHTGLHHARRPALQQELREADAPDVARDPRHGQRHPEPHAGAPATPHPNPHARIYGTGHRPPHGTAVEPARAGHATHRFLDLLPGDGPGRFHGRLCRSPAVGRIRIA